MQVHLNVQIYTVTVNKTIPAPTWRLIIIIFVFSRNAFIKPKWMDCYIINCLTEADEKIKMTNNALPRIKETIGTYCSVGLKTTFLIFYNVIYSIFFSQQCPVLSQNESIIKR